MGDLDQIADAFAGMPDIASVRRLRPEGLLTGNGWQVWLIGSWLGEHAGRGETIQAAYYDAKLRLENIRSAA